MMQSRRGMVQGRRVTRSLNVIAVLLSAIVLPLAADAQSGSCSDVPLVNADACQKAQDLWTYVLPQLGAGLVGGNPVLGSSRVLGHIGHFNAGIRATGFAARIPTVPRNLDVSATGRVATHFAVEEHLAAVPALDAAVGIFPGIPLGVTRVGSVDGLVSFMYVPNASTEGADGNVRVTIDHALRMGFGARVGLIEEAIIVPEISVAYLRRGTPRVDIAAQTDEATIDVNRLRIDVSSWRAMATKTFLSFALAGGIGGDLYDSRGTIHAQHTATGIGSTLSADRKITRTNWFVNLSLNAWAAHVAAEYGVASGGALGTFNTFDTPADASRSYASIGLRLGW
jgi:hypothetical protein